MEHRNFPEDPLHVVGYRKDFEYDVDADGKYEDGGELWVEARNSRDIQSWVWLDYYEYSKDTLVAECHKILGRKTSPQVRWMWRQS